MYDNIWVMYIPVLIVLAIIIAILVVLIVFKVRNKSFKIYYNFYTYIGLPFSFLMYAGGIAAAMNYIGKYKQEDSKIASPGILLFWAVILTGLFAYNIFVFIQLHKCNKMLYLKNFSSLNIQNLACILLRPLGSTIAICLVNGVGFNFVVLLANGIPWWIFNFIYFYFVDLPFSPKKNAKAVETKINTYSNVSVKVDNTADSDKAENNIEEIEKIEKPKVNSIKFCPYCGASVRTNATFCYKCGQKIID